MKPTIVNLYKDGKLKYSTSKKVNHIIKIGSPFVFMGREYLVTSVNGCGHLRAINAVR